MRRNNTTSTYTCTSTGTVHVCVSAFIEEGYRDVLLVSARFPAGSPACDITRIGKYNVMYCCTCVRINTTSCIDTTDIWTVGIAAVTIGRACAPHTLCLLAPPPARAKALPVVVRAARRGVTVFQLKRLGFGAGTGLRLQIVNPIGTILQAAAARDPGIVIMPHDHDHDRHTMTCNPLASSNYVYRISIIANSVLRLYLICTD